MTTPTRLRCDGRSGCAGPVTAISDRGFLCCEDHRPARNDRYARSRKLRAREVRAIQAGETITYHPSTRAEHAARIARERPPYAMPGDVAGVDFCPDFYAPGGCKCPPEN